MGPTATDSTVGKLALLCSTYYWRDHWRSDSVSVDNSMHNYYWCDILSKAHGAQAYKASTCCALW